LKFLLLDHNTKNFNFEADFYLPKIEMIFDVHARIIFNLVDTVFFCTLFKNQLFTKSVLHTDFEINLFRNSQKDPK